MSPLSTGEAGCAACGALIASASTLASQADAVRAALEGAIALATARPGGVLAEAYGGDTTRAMLTALNRTAELALKHARASACAAGTCGGRPTP